jgi:hypothetical protein
MDQAAEAAFTAVSRSGSRRLYRQAVPGRRGTAERPTARGGGARPEQADLRLLSVPTPELGETQIFGDLASLKMQNYNARSCCRSMAT